MIGCTVPAFTLQSSRGTYNASMNATPKIDRTVHNAANFNPEEYEVLDYLDNQPPKIQQFLPGFGAPATAYDFAKEKYEAARAAWELEMDSYFPDRRNHNPSIKKCTHCGNGTVRYIAAVKHRPTGQVIVFGDVCVERLQFANRNEFKAAQLRAKAAQGNANLALYTKRLRFLEAYPEFSAVVNNREELSKPVHANNSFAHDILDKLNKYGSLSEKQVAAFMSSIQRDNDYEVRRAERAAAEQARRATAQPAPDGRCQVEGEVTQIKGHESAFGIVPKMVVLLTTGAKVWLTVTSGQEVSVGDKVKFTATFTRSNTDQFFAFGKRPSKLEVASRAAVS